MRLLFTDFVDLLEKFEKLLRNRFTDGVFKYAPKLAAYELLTHPRCAFLFTILRLFRGQDLYPKRCPLSLAVKPGRGTRKCPVTSVSPPSTSIPDVQKRFVATKVPE